MKDDYFDGMPMTKPIMDQDDELARLRQMNTDLLKISADLDAIVQESKRLKAQNFIFRGVLRAVLYNLKEWQAEDEGEMAMPWPLIEKIEYALNQSSGD
jgi:hypothetical protein